MYFNADWMFAEAHLYCDFLLISSKKHHLDVEIKQSTKATVIKSVRLLRDVRLE